MGLAGCNSCGARPVRDITSSFRNFFARTGVPLVLNTSFNDNEPIVCTPEQAIATFRKTGIDALFMGDIYLTSEA